MNELIQNTNTYLYLFIFFETFTIIYLIKLMNTNRENSIKEFRICEEKIRAELEKKIADKEEKSSNRLLALQENINIKEGIIVDQLNKLEIKQEKITIKEKELEVKSDNLRLIIANQESLNIAQNKEFLDKIEHIAQLTIEEAKNELKKIAEQELASDLYDWQNKYIQSIREEAQDTAAEIVSLAIQRCSSDVANEQTVTNIKLNSESDKGKIIGKNGRNLQWLEKTLGVEFIIDDSNECLITISGFSSIRRHIAKKTLERLLEDGRIHPAFIEEMCEKSKSDLALEIAEAGERACAELGIFDFSAKLIRLIGRLKFRTSYGQNMLKHAVEMAKLSKNLAIELNKTFPQRQPIDIDICIKGALLHDIGKAIDEETMPKGNHIDLGEKICEMFDLNWKIKKCITSHHNESYYDNTQGFCIEAVIVDACDNISGGRPGARKDTVESYYQRMEALETIANKTKGVTKSWIMRGNREIWVFFDTAVVTPEEMRVLIKNVANNIESNVNYPGEIKVIGLWEDKIVEYAH
jgi:ribonucrease Y